MNRRSAMALKASLPPSRVAVALALIFIVAFLLSGPALAQNSTGLVSLKAIPVPEPPNLDDFIQNRVAAVILGKALFWDMQVGSDGIQACATCHFRAGADGRFRGLGQ